MMIDLRQDELDSQAYFEWLSKFEAKKTTDDCYTPPAVYDAVLEYVNDHVLNLDGLKVIRPFYPKGDYTDLSQYDENSIVIDNPPFSLSARIYKFYQEHNIKFFLFSPALTVFSSMRHIHGITAVIAPHGITYGNGAVVNTSFVTNLMPSIKVKTAPILLEKLIKAEKLLKAELPKYNYPDNVLMVNSLHKLCKAGIDFEVNANSCQHISQLASQKDKGKALFGGGLIVSDCVAEKLKAEKLKAEKLKAEKTVIIWELSDSERQIIDELNKAALDAVF